MKSASRFCLVLTTAGSEKNSIQIARVLLASKLAACVNILPGARSYYRWKGKAIRDQEWLLIIKTRKSLLRNVQKKIKMIHTYVVPEILSLNLLKGDAKYLKWLEKETTN